MKKWLERVTLTLAAIAGLFIGLSLNKWTATWPWWGVAIMQGLEVVYMFAAIMLWHRVDFVGACDVIGERMQTAFRLGVGLGLMWFFVVPLTCGVFMPFYVVGRWLKENHRQAYDRLHARQPWIKDGWDEFFGIVNEKVEAKLNGQ